MPESETPRGAHPSEMSKEEGDAVLLRLRMERARLEFLLTSNQGMNEKKRKAVIENYRCVDKIIGWAENPKKETKY